MLKLDDLDFHILCEVDDCIGINLDREVKEINGEKYIEQEILFGILQDFCLEHYRQEDEIDDLKDYIDDLQNK